MGIMTLTLIPTSNYLLNLTSDSVLVKIVEMINEVVESPGNKKMTYLMRSFENLK